MSLHFAGTSWKSAQFSNPHFRLPAGLSGGKHWSGIQFKCHQFASRHFRGLPGFVKAAVVVARSSGYGYAILAAKRKREDDEAILLAINEAIDDFS